MPVYIWILFYVFGCFTSYQLGKLAGRWGYRLWIGVRRFRIHRVSRRQPERTPDELRRASRRNGNGQPALPGKDQSKATWFPPPWPTPYQAGHWRRRRPN
jgi:hypothetical protein